MALLQIRTEMEKIKELKRKQKVEQAKFRKMILENRDFVISVLKDSSVGTEKTEGGSNTGVSKGE